MKKYIVIAGVVIFQAVGTSYVFDIGENLTLVLISLLTGIGNGAFTEYRYRTIKNNHIKHSDDKQQALHQELLLIKERLNIE